MRLVRALSDGIGETVTGVAEIHAHNTAGLELARFSHRLGEIFETRFRIYLWKFIIKFINNSVNHLGPFFFYSAGGWLVIEGRLEIGTLIAVLAANKDLAAPWKELLNYYQRLEDARIKYQQVVEQFEPPDMLGEDLQRAEPEDIPPLAGDFAAAALTLEDDTGGPGALHIGKISLDPSLTTKFSSINGGTITTGMPVFFHLRVALPKT